jgi:hypothetical protein
VRWCACWLDQRDDDEPTQIAIEATHAALTFMRRRDPALGFFVGTICGACCGRYGWS